MSVTRAAAFGLLTAGGLLYASTWAPYWWGHDLNGACRWEQTWNLPIGRQGPRMLAMQEACRAAKGDHSPTRTVNLIVRKWPSAAERAAWRGE